MISCLISYHRVFIAWKKEKNSPYHKSARATWYLFFIVLLARPLWSLSTVVSHILFNMNSPFSFLEPRVILISYSNYFFLHQELSSEQFFKTSLSKDKDIYKTRWGWQDLTERLGKNFALPRKKTRLRWKIAFQNVGRLKAKLSNGGKPNRAELIYKP